MRNNFWASYLACENRLVISFRHHALIKRLDKMSAGEAVAVLLQMGHTSSQFVRWYDDSKLGVRNKAAKKAIRRILWDEISIDAPTHQDNRVADLLKFGVPLKQIVTTPASAITAGTIEEARWLTTLTDDPYHDLKVVVTLQIMGERLAGETYRPIVQNMKRWFGVDPADSVFYRQHFEHDNAGGSHATCFGPVLQSLIVSEQAAALAEQFAERAMRAKLRFFKQF